MLLRWKRSIKLKVCYRVTTVAGALKGRDVRKGKWSEGIYVKGRVGRDIRQGKGMGREGRSIKKSIKNKKFHFSTHPKNTHPPQSALLIESVCSPTLYMGKLTLIFPNIRPPPSLPKWYTREGEKMGYLVLPLMQSIITAKPIKLAVSFSIQSLQKSIRGILSKKWVLIIYIWKIAHPVGISYATPILARWVCVLVEA